MSATENLSPKRNLFFDKCGSILSSKILYISIPRSTISGDWFMLVRVPGTTLPLKKDVLFLTECSKGKNPSNSILLFHISIIACSLLSFPNNFGLSNWSSR